ncbi:hypothetical protein LTR50_000307 [Elasticomyces elasticus]|nr:hypothetical protein LTR50_000307 [Elasticomyces elasticus]
MEQVKQAVNTVVAAVQPSHQQTVLITGASGFLAAHVLTAFLEAGYKVRGTVRSESTAEKVRKSHAKYVDNLSFAIVRDITASGAFDEAVDGVDGVIHTASPFVVQVQDNEKELLDPAIKGTVGILTSIQKKNPDVKRVVITSSFAAVINMDKGMWPEHTYTEADWNPTTYEEAKTGNGATAYCASKTLAERAAFDYVKENHPNFTVTSLCPPFVYGPNEHTVTDVTHLNTSSADIWRLMNGTEKEVPDTSFWAFADARDVAQAHLKAYETPAAAGQRYLITSGNYSYQQVCDIIRAEVPEARERTPEGEPGKPLPPVYRVSHEKAERELGMTFRSLRETITDTARSLLELEKEAGHAH